MAGVKACTKAGTSCGSCLPLVRKLVTTELEKAGVEVRIPQISLCTDNGAMVAALGAEVVRRGIAPSSLDLAVDSSLPVTRIVAA